MQNIQKKNFFILLACGLFGVNDKSQESFSSAIMKLSSSPQLFLFFQDEISKRSLIDLVYALLLINADILEMICNNDSGIKEIKEIRSEILKRDNYLVNKSKQFFFSENSKNDFKISIDDRSNALDDIYKKLKETPNNIEADMKNKTKSDIENLMKIVEIILKIKEMIKKDINVSVCEYLIILCGELYNKYKYKNIELDIKNFINNSVKIINLLDKKKLTNSVDDAKYNSRYEEFGLERSWLKIEPWKFGIK